MSCAPACAHPLAHTPAPHSRVRLTRVGITHHSRRYHSSAYVAKTTKMAEVNWLDKNNDTLDVGWLQKLAHSKLDLLAGMYKADFEASKSRKVRPVSNMSGVALSPHGRSSVTSK